MTQIASRWGACATGLFIVLMPPFAAQADIGWVEVDVDGAAPERVVTLMALDTLQQVHDLASSEQLKSAPPDSNSADLARSLGRSRIWTVKVMRVFEGKQPKIERRTIEYLWLAADCSNGSLLAMSSELVRKNPNDPQAIRGETFDVQYRNLSIPVTSRWQRQILRLSCDQKNWRAATSSYAPGVEKLCTDPRRYGGNDPNRACHYVISCSDTRMNPLGLGCAGSLSDYDLARFTAHNAMNDPAQAKAVQ